MTFFHIYSPSNPAIFLGLSTFAQRVFYIIQNRHDFRPEKGTGWETGCGNAVDVAHSKSKTRRCPKHRACHYHCWQETYSGLISDEYLEAMNEAQNMERFEGLYLQTGRYQYVVLDGSQIVGFFDISPAREEYAPYEVQGLYLRKSYHGHGYGRTIMDYIKKNAVQLHFTCGVSAPILLAGTMFIWAEKKLHAKTFGSESRSTK